MPLLGTHSVCNLLCTEQRDGDDPTFVTGTTAIDTDLEDDTLGEWPGGKSPNDIYTYQNDTPLLGRSAKGMRPSSNAQQSAKHLQGVRRTAIAFTRSMIGTAILYMPRMFHNGGLLFSTIVLFLTCCLSTYNMILLSRCNDISRRSSYGSIAEAAMGRAGRWLVDTLLVLNQAGWVPVYYIFVAENLFQAVPGLEGKISREGLISAQLLVYIPLSWLRQIKHLATTNMLANLCVAIGLSVCIAYTFYKLAADGTQEIVPINTKDAYLFIGSVALAFEGMALVLPIKGTMKRKDRFEGMVMCIMVAISLLCWLVGAVGYMAYGHQTQSFITNNLPRHGVLGASVRVLYSFAILCTFALQLFPSFLMEGYIFGSCQLPTLQRKILKNIFRTCLVTLTCLVAIYGGKNLDHFVSLIGALGSIPLGLIIPTVLHLCLFWRKSTVTLKAVHVGLVLIGTAACLISVVITLRTW